MFPESKWGVSASRRVVDHSGEVPKGGGVYKVGAPYKVGGRWYQPREQPDYDRVGTASWYGSDFHGRHTANGEVYDMHALTAAHPTLPMPSYAYVTNLSNNRTILVRINDRGPYVGDRMIDLSRASADALGLRGRGTGRVRVRYAGPAPLDGSDHRERQFAATRSWQGQGPGADIAAVESAVSAHEYANYQSSGRARPTAWRPQDEQRTASVQRTPAPGYGQDPDLPYGRPPAQEQRYDQRPYRQAYAEPQSQSNADDLWSPERYRAAANAR
jgi:rare lipoprotein A